MRCFGFGILAALFLFGPDQARAWSFEDALRAMARGDFRGAVSILDRLNGGQARNEIEALVLTGRALFLSQRYQQSEAAYAKAVLKAPLNSAQAQKARFGLAECYAAQGRFEEAEKLFSSVLSHLTAETRREQLARRYILLGDERLEPPENKKAPDPSRAERFYRGALELGIEGALAYQTRLKIGRCLMKQKRFPEAALQFESLLQAGADSSKLAEAGYLAGKSHHQAKQEASARRHLREVLVRHPRSPFAAKAAFLLSRTYGMPKPPDGISLLRGQEALLQFIRHYPNHQRVPQARLELALAAMQLKHFAEAEDALREYLKASGPEEKLALARFNLGACLAAQGRFDEAVEAWKAYLREHASHGNWLQARQGIEELAWKKAQAAHAKKDWAEAASLYTKFAEWYPATERTPQALLVAGQAYAEMGKVDEAFEVFRSLASRFPQSGWAGASHLETGLLHEEKRNDFANARKAYKKASEMEGAQNSKQLASIRLKALDQPSLVVKAPKTFRSGEKPQITWLARNLESVNLRLYRIQAQDFFRDRLAMGEVGSLDIALCAPDRAWTVPVAGYQRYKRIEQQVPLGIEQPGLYLLNLGAGDLEATTALLLTDLGVILKAAPGEVFVFAQDLRSRMPLPGTQVLVADSQRVLLEGQTGPDGVFQGRLSQDDPVGQLRVFASRGQHLAWTELEYPGGQPETAASPRAFLFSDRPVYRPGDRVEFAGMLRDAWKDQGYWSFKPGTSYRLSVHDPGGREVFRDTVALDEFGLFHTQTRLDPSARTGSYSFVLSSALEPSFAGHFEVQAYRHTPYEISVTFDQPIVFQGEPLEGTIRVRHQHGTPAAHQSVRYGLDRAESFETGITDQDGQLRFSFSTRGFEETQRVQLEVQLSRHQLVHQATAMVAVQGFDVRLEVFKATLFAGQPFDLTIRVNGPDHRPRGAVLELHALRVLEGGAGEVRMSRQELTVPDTGLLRIPLTLEQDGLHLLRVFGHDRARHPVTAELAVTTVGKEQPGLFLDLDRTVQTLGTPARVKVRSRLDRARVLFTYETDRILGFQTALVKKGDNQLKLPLSEALAPNFVLAMSAMEGDKFYTAYRDIQVTRQLDLTVRPNRQRFQPGEEVSLTIIAKDGNGRPVDARLVVSVVDQALFKIFPENLPDLLKTFHRPHPIGKIDTTASNTFGFPEVAAKIIEPAEVLEAEGSAAMAALKARRKLMTDKATERFAELAQISPNLVLEGSAGSGVGAGGFGLAGRGAGGGGRGISFAKPSVMGGLLVRRYFGDTAAFFPEVRTGPDGVANVRFKLPDAITTWRVTTRGVTRDTQLGENRTELVASRSFWVDLALPPEIEEGDRFQPMVRVFNETKQDLAVKLELTTEGAASPHQLVVQAPSFKQAEASFPAVEVPEQAAGRRMQFGLVAGAGDLGDRLLKEVPVRPRGIQESLAVSGQLGKTADRTLVLDRALTDPTLTIRLDARMAQLFLAGRLDSVLFGDRPEEALVALNVLDQLGWHTKDAMRDMVKSRLVRSLVHLLNVQQGDGGFGFSSQSSSSSLPVSASAVRALARARSLAGELNWQFPQADFDRAVTFLKNGLTSLSPEDWMNRAVLLYALAHVGSDQVPFVQLHRLHRLRESLPLGALALLGHTWILLGRPEKAAEAAKTLRPKVEFRVPEKTRPGWLFSWGAEPADLALALSLIGEVSPADPLVKRGTDWLLGQGETLGFFYPREAEAASQALSTLLSAAKREERFRVRALVNGQPAGTVEVLGGWSTSAPEITVAPSLLKPGENKLSLQLEGSGSCFFVATLTAYRKEAPAAPPEAPVKVSRTIQPVPEPYRGREITAGFESVLPGSLRWINQTDRIPAGRRVRITLEVTKNFDQPLSHCVLTDRIPPGFELLEGADSDPATHLKKEGRRLAFFIPESGRKTAIGYELLAINPGSYHFPPAVVTSLANPETRALGGAKSFSIDAGGADLVKVRPTPDELYQVGIAAAEQEPLLAIEKLEQLSHGHQLREEVAQQVLGTLLFASIDVGDHPRIVKYFELAKEKNPKLIIPFNKIRPVQEAYRALKVHESGLQLARGLAEARFMAEVRAVGILESEEEMAEALALLKELVGTFPDNSLNAEATYAFSQVVFGRADRVAQGEPVEGFDRPGLLWEVIGLMSSYLGRFPKDPQAPPAIYSLASALLERSQPDQAVKWCDAGLTQHPGSNLVPAIAYLKAYAHFRLGEYRQSLDLCRRVESESKDQESREMARYIMAQIYHARGMMDRALEQYRLVRDRFRDADETVQESLKPAWSIPEVLMVPEGERPTLKLTRRNIDRVDLRAYRVDPMKLYLLKGSLSDLREINLAGIRPVLSRAYPFAPRPGATREEKLSLQLPGPGAYLVLARGGSQPAHCLVLWGSLATEVTEDSPQGRVRVTVRDARGRPVPGARVQLKGSQNQRFTAGHTDLRGIFIAEEIQGSVTVIARHGNAYGLYRGNAELSGETQPEEETVHRKKAIYDFEDDLSEGELSRPADRQKAKSFFLQEVKGMSVEQAK